MAEPRRFLAPWSAEKIAGGYVVRDANGQALAYVYGRFKPVRGHAGKNPHRRRGAPDRGEHCQAAGIAEARTRREHLGNLLKYIRISKP
jgi:hypothetical protein